MPKKDLKLGSPKPQLATHYEHACRAVYNKHRFVVKQSYGLFRDFEKKLRDEGIFPMDYALGISEKLKKWTKKNGWAVLPTKTFCSEWAMELYKTELSNRQFEHTSDEDSDLGALLEDELKVARYSAETGIDFQSAVEELRPVLSEAWLKLYKKGTRAALMVEALDLLSEERGQHLRTYADLV